MLTWFVNNRNPSITETITSGGAPVDLTGATVKFKMRAVGSSTLKVNQPASFTGGVAGTVRYDWAALDVDTPGQYLVWWEVTVGTKTQDLNEALIEFRPHSAPGTPVGYVELEQVKATLSLTGQTYADQDILAAINAASRGIDDATSRRFYLDTNSTQVRYYTPISSRRVEIDDLSVITSVKIDRTGDGVYEETWTNGTEFVLEPANAAADYRPFESIIVRRWSGRWLPCYVERAVEVTGQFGWTTIPDPIKTATGILAAKLFKRVREAPFGIVTVGADVGVAMRIARTDPDVYTLISGYDRTVPFV